MRLEKDDQAFLWTCGKRPATYQERYWKLSADEFADNKFTRLAIERLVIILGEAAAKMSESYRLAHAEIDWRRIQRLRNSMAHEYGSRLALMFYRTCRDFVVPLSLQLDGLCPEPPADSL